MKSAVFGLKTILFPPNTVFFRKNTGRKTYFPISLLHRIPYTFVVPSTIKRVHHAKSSDFIHSRHSFPSLS